MSKHSRTRAQGFVECANPDGTTTVTETFTCCHCGNVHDVPPKDAPEVGFCRGCMARECLSCAHSLGGRCTPFEKRIEEYERASRNGVCAALGI